MPPSAISLEVAVTEESEIPVSRAMASRWVMRGEVLEGAGGTGKKLDPVNFQGRWKIRLKTREDDRRKRSRRSGLAGEKEEPDLLCAGELTWQRSAKSRNRSNDPDSGYRIDDAPDGGLHWPRFEPAHPPVAKDELESEDKGGQYDPLGNGNSTVKAEAPSHEDDISGEGLEEVIGERHATNFCQDRGEGGEAAAVKEECEAS